PVPSAGGIPPPPPPPPMADRDSGYSSGLPAAALPKPDDGRVSLLGDIQKAGGIGSLKKVDRTKINDRSAATVGGSSGSAAAAGASPAGPGGMANALAAALQKRKDKVSKSDDEEEDDDW
ncbi:hypothetical protein TARUN_10315, partial [Trichoderma arundinaceum]